MHDDAAGLAELRALGARSVPVVAKDGRFVFAQRIDDVAELLGIPGLGAPALSPAELVARLDTVLEAAARGVRQLPPARLGDKLPNRNRSYRELAHHIFRIPEAFVEADAGGDELTQASFVTPPGPEHDGIDGLARYGERVRARVTGWWRDGDRDGGRRMPTYYGRQPMHEVLERTVWHAAQHVRQLAMVLEGLGIAPERPLTPAELAGLPLPEKVWDE